jgi:hypothetical protein
MAYDNPGKTITLPASADLSGKQYYLVGVDANGRVALATAGSRVIGVLQNKPDAIDKQCTVMTDGVSKVVQSATLPPGTVIASDANGKAAATGALSNTAGVLLENGGADLTAGTMLIQVSHIAAS